MGFDDWIKDLFDNIDWGDLVKSVLQWVIDHPNIYSAGLGLVISLFEIIDGLSGMSEEEAKEAFMEACERLRNRPDLPMDFEI